MKKLYTRTFTSIEKFFSFLKSGKHEFDSYSEGIVCALIRPDDLGRFPKDKFNIDNWQTAKENDLNVLQCPGIEANTVILVLGGDFLNPIKSGKPDEQTSKTKKN